MLQKLYVPTIDTYWRKFLANRELSREEFGEMVLAHFLKTDRQVDMYTKGYYGFHESEFKRQLSKNYSTIDTTNNKEDYKLKSCDAIITTTKHTNADDDFFNTYIRNRDMFIIIVDINSDTLEPDTESEIRFWRDDSDKILKDKGLPDDVKLKTLPKTHFCVDTKYGKALLSNCKLIEMYKVKNHPYKFAILVEKISLI